MKNLMLAMEEEQRYVADRLKGVKTALPERLSAYGYADLGEYFKDKQEYLFNEWKPDVYRIAISEFAQEVENAINEKKYGIYIPVADGMYAYHGTDTIDYDLCKNIGVRVVELNYTGGTIIGSSADLSIEIIAPNNIGLTSTRIIQKFHEIISRYISNVEISENDILVNGEKVMGSMQRSIGNVIVWAAQVSFADYSETIERICNKKSSKKPSHIDSAVLSKDALEMEVVAWLQKQ